MSKGYVRLSRKFFSNDLWNERRVFNRCEAWLDLIQLARYEDDPQKDCIGKREVVYGRGQYPASIKLLSRRWQWPDKKVRCFLEYLKKEKMISVDCLQGVNLITLDKYDEYNPRGTNNELKMSDLDADGARGTIKGTIRGTNNELKMSDLDMPRGTIRGTIRGTNTNKEKKENNKKEILSKESTKKKDAAIAATLSRKEVFYQSLIPFLDRYSREMIREFFDYWSEMNRSCTKMRFEQQPTWEVTRRLAAWASKDNQFNKNGISRQINVTAEQRARDVAKDIAAFIADDAY